MTDHHRHGCGRVGSWISVLCAALGVLTAYLMIGPLALDWLINIFHLPIEVIVGVVALFVAAALLGRKAGTFLCERRNDLPMNVLIGIGLAFSSIAVAVWSATLVGVLRELPNISQSPHPLGILYIIFLPLLVICIYGGIPAVLLGILYGFLVRHQLWKLRP